MNKVHLCGHGDVKCTVYKFGSRLLNITFEEPVTIKEGQEMEILLNTMRTYTLARRVKSWDDAFKVLKDEVKLHYPDKYDWDKCKNLEDLRTVLKNAGLLIDIMEEQ